MKSIIQSDKECFFCRTRNDIHEHHVYEGRFRQRSEHYGLKVYLCGRHHNMSDASVHMDESMNKALKKRVQKIAMEYYGWTAEEFREKVGKNYE